MHTLTVNLSDKTYPIYIKKGLLDSIGKEIKKIYKNKKIAIITDSNIEKLYGERIKNNLIKENFLTNKIIIEPGEKSKFFKVLEQVCNKLLELKLNRGDLIITFGGGVVGDLGGFAASMLLRGISFIQIPTSLIGQIDSSIGGKVAINTDYGKNLIGSFYHPKAVFIDPELLKTLDERYLYDGMAEMIKYGAIKDRKLFNNLLQYKGKEDLFNNIEELIYTCCSIKKNLVEKDEKDNGERMLLNFGHTIGHGIEKYFQYKKFTHGEAVAMGMYAITKNSEDFGLTEKGTSDLIKKIIIKYNLPWKIPTIDKSEIIDIISRDKKNNCENMNIILLKNIGNGFIKKINIKDMNKVKFI
ncbi:3-dehydroquinate synthase [Clostridium acetireducens DSM 10703]|uniref:3-dehydroquinate synthase n=1 Tax=Clostridium acetireducens DSM 10703 TaxID=1121290 RepID=A0A1E8EYM4_9CLOT|nr:3-dehydroquinate synthase [Clostridium acetireducens]OFI06077.1 3-dehydroquinate synthase [Clostridium acetireducens DSM 10703]